MAFPPRLKLSFRLKVVSLVRRGLKWDSNGEVNYDTDMNVIGGTFLANGTMCQPAENLLGAMNPYKTQAAA